MSIENVEVVTHCPKCKGEGHVFSHKGVLLRLECANADCRSKWRTYSKTCNVCKKPNGYFVDGPCASCYEQRYQSS